MEAYALAYEITTAMVKTTEELLLEISAATRITREPRLLALLGELKEYLDSRPPVPDTAVINLEPREGRIHKVHPHRNEYMREYMAKRRAKTKEAKLANIDPPPNTDRDSNQATGSEYLWSEDSPGNDKSKKDPIQEE